jgi:hypothetical protein
MYNQTSNVDSLDISQIDIFKKRLITHMHIESDYQMVELLKEKMMTEKHEHENVF